MRLNKEKNNAEVMATMSDVHSVAKLDRSPVLDVCIIDSFHDVDII